MGLTSTAFLAVLVVLTVAVPALGVIGWGRVRGPRPVRWAVRLGVLLLSQLLVCALVVVLLNNANQFYPSWGELFGDVGSVTTTSTGSGALDRSLQHDEAHGAARSRVLTVGVPVADRHTSIPAYVYLPAAYFQPAYAHRVFPVLELLDGFPGSPQSWTHTQSLDIVGVLGREFAAGRAAPFIAVMPEQNFQGAHDGECIDAVGGTQVETTLVSDVRSVVTRDFRAGRQADEWSVMGYSTGGYCAVNMIMRHPGLFGSAVALSGYVTPYVDDTTGAIFGPGTAYRHANDPLWLASHGDDPPVSILLAFCDGDPQPRREALRFADAVRAPLRLSLLHVPGGAHNFPTFALEEPVAVDWVARHFAYPLAPGVGVRGRTPYSVGPGRPNDDGSTTDAGTAHRRTG